MNIALILAGGSGQRMGQDVPKQFLCIDNKPVFIYTLENFQKCDAIDAICVSCLPGWEATIHAYAGQFNITKLRTVVSGGENRFFSILNLLEAIKPFAHESDIIMTYDAVRPIITDEIILDAIAKTEEIGAAVGVIPCFDSMFSTEEQCSQVIGKMQRRELLWRGMGPDTTRFGTALQLFEKYRSTNTKLTLSEMFLDSGLPVAKSKSSSRCIKLTTLEDVELFQAMLKYEKYDWLK